MPMTQRTVAQLSALPRAEFIAALDGIFEHSPWVAEAAWEDRPFATVNALHDAMCQAVIDAGEAPQLALICAHPELAGKAAVRGELTAESTREQAGAGLDQCSAEEFARLTELNDAYKTKFGFPYILAVRGHTRSSIIENFATRLESSRADEIEECLRQIFRIAGFRLQDLVRD
ncbi:MULTISPECIES: 2-oxo-4-hydroxy-4-carboxy-5-ureidoimidazoline decarboxylase [Pandoraea]|uniref:2-oxo-4-hydroxy-4-carboxy-5-ureidoimidazoline decarboxylase n=2 Tax=Pandoraea TaxID=93217 RepID=UPI001F5C27B7|nr:MULTISPECIES: 2-oxo-4-hydroxy-4-carboxy-5-ureidoimidazoline decarboxylase [Pandoraea]MCI3208400.1 OHCU decarboxylase [Pandoraea sp. LA3]MDN4586429.1 OHCU decarboxylase [Pandoraea capi]